jgi:FkbM family methyltransferase
MNLELDETKYTQKLMLNSKEYEPEITDCMKSILKKDSVFIDCGAHVGYFTVLGAELCSQVWSFEAEKENYKQLVRNIKGNEYENVKYYHKAVGDECKWIELFICLDNDGGNALWDVGEHDFNTKSKDTPTKQKVRMVTLNSVVKGRVDLIKIDVEGCEFKVLQGAERILKEEHPAVILEINDFALMKMGDNKEGIFSFMKKLGYSCYDLQTGGLWDSSTVHKYVYNVVFIKLNLN